MALLSTFFPLFQCQNSWTLVVFTYCKLCVSYPIYLTSNAYSYPFLSIILSFLVLHKDRFLVSMYGPFSCGWRVSREGMKVWKVMLEMYAEILYLFFFLAFLLVILCFFFHSQVFHTSYCSHCILSQPSTHTITLSTVFILTSIKSLLSKVLTFLLLDKSMVF